MSNPIDFLTRFATKYEAKESGCWEWTASLTRYGYGQIRKGTVRTGGRTMVKAHRVSWEIHRGSIPDGLFVCHKCDNRRCVNPDHLFLGTQADNMADMRTKGRGESGERHHQTTLTDRDVDRIRELGGTLLQREIAEQFGVRQQAVSRILRGERRTKRTA